MSVEIETPDDVAEFDVLAELEALEAKIKAPVAPIYGPRESDEVDAYLEACAVRLATWREELKALDAIHGRL